MLELESTAKKPPKMSIQSPRVSSKYLLVFARFAMRCNGSVYRSPTGRGIV